MTTRKVLGEEGQTFIYEEFDGVMILTGISFKSGEYIKMGKQQIVDAPRGITLANYWYEYSDNGPVEKIDVLPPNFVDTDPDGQG